MNRKSPRLLNNPSGDSSNTKIEISSINNTTQINKTPNSINEHNSHNNDECISEECFKSSALKSGSFV
ncbi:unnamed protein product [Heterobilharzia americana]|nr:unnamed protein product [Heterobilharzia americana]